MARSVTLAALALYLLASGLIAAEAMVLTPYSDMLDWIGRWEAWQAGGSLLTFLFEPHNFNRPAGTFGTLALDIQALGAQGYAFVAVGVLSLSAAAALLALAARRAAPESLALSAAALAAMLTLMAGNILDATIPININYAQALAFAAGAIVLAGYERPLPRIAALACAMLAPLGNAAAIAVWPALVLMTLRGRQWRWLAVVLIVGGAYSVLYAVGQAAPAREGALDVAGAASLVLHYLGLPWTRAVPAAGAVLGALLLAAGLAAIVLRGRTAGERTAVGLIAFSLATAALAGLARTGYGSASDVPLRYAVFLAPLHVGLLMLALPYLARAPRWLPAAAACGLVLHQVASGYVAVQTAERNRRMIADFQAGLRTPGMALTIHPDLDHAERVYRSLAARGLYTPGPVPAKPRP